MKVIITRDKGLACEGACRTGSAPINEGPHAENIISRERGVVFKSVSDSWGRLNLNAGLVHLVVPTAPRKRTTLISGARPPDMLRICANQIRLAHIVAFGKDEIELVSEGEL
jgi:hypothetical protein